MAIRDLDPEGVEDGNADDDHVHGKVGCDAEWQHFLCTRPLGHDGDHAAWGTDNTLYQRWAQ